MAADKVRKPNQNERKGRVRKVERICDSRVGISAARIAASTVTVTIVDNSPLNVVDLYFGAQRFQMMGFSHVIQKPGMTQVK